MINVPYEDMPREIEALLGEIEQLEQEKQQLKETNEVLMKCLKIDKDKIDFNVAYAEHLEKVLDEIRAYINNIPYKDLEPIEVQVISKILDKVNV